MGERIQFETRIEKFGEMGEKTGWRYILIPAGIASVLKPGWKKSFRVMGNLDSFFLKGQAIVPMGGGDFILPLKANLRKELRKDAGASIRVDLREDTDEPGLDPDFEDCLSDAPEARVHFETLTKSHQRYFSKWISEAKTIQTKEKRIVESLRALSLKWGFSEMLLARKKS